MLSYVALVVILMVSGAIFYVGYWALQNENVERLEQQRGLLRMRQVSSGDKTRSKPQRRRP